MDIKQSSEKRFALLIDADNVSAKYIKPITDELSKYGTVTYKRIYGDWTLTLHAKWKDALLENSITPIQQFGYTQGKNATDSAMIIDAMDILYTRSVEGFCIVSSDSDFTRLASRIRERHATFSPRWSFCWATRAASRADATGTVTTRARRRTARALEPPP